jgi:hypothetical protein
MIDIITVTAQYSNALMVAILPQVSDFAAKLHLPVDLPITEKSVQHFNCAPLNGNPTGSFVMTNGFEFLYSFGHVDTFASPHCYARIDNFDEFPNYYGKLEINQDEAVALARRALTDLGYDLKQVFADQLPQVTPPTTRDGHLIPIYQIEWHSPLETLSSERSIYVEVDGERKCVQNLQLMGRSFFGVPPKIDVADPSASSMSLTESNALTHSMLPQVSAFIAATRLPIPLPISADDIATVKSGIIRLKNGFRFWSGFGNICGFTAPDAVFALPGAPQLPISSYLGQWNLSKEEAAQIVRNALRRLGYLSIAFEAKAAPSVSTPTKVGSYVVPRFHFSWQGVTKKFGTVLWEVNAEVDSGTGAIKSLSVDGIKDGISVEHVDGVNN